MAGKSDREKRKERTAQREYMRGGKGRKDEVGRSGIYPASSPDAPADAEIRRPGDFVHHTAPSRKPKTEEKDKP